MPHDGWHPHDHPHHHHEPRHPKRRMVLAAATFLPFGGANAQTRSTRRSALRTRANRFLAALDDAQRNAGDDRLRVGQSPRLAPHPSSRQGLTLGEMKPAQRDAAQALFASVLNERGLQAIENVRTHRRRAARAAGPVPRSRPLLRLDLWNARPLRRWGFWLEGHHLSLNVALPAAGPLISVTPSFIGSHPRDGARRSAQGPAAAWSRRGLGAAAHGLPSRKSSDARRSSPSAPFGDIVASPAPR